MKIKWLRRAFLALTFISTIISVTCITFKVVQKNNTDVTSRTNNKNYRSIKIDQNDYPKLLTYKLSTYVFDLNNIEYYLVHKTLELYPELANKSFSFSVDSITRPKTVCLAINTSNEIKWFYSIINKQKS